MGGDGAGLLELEYGHALDSDCVGYDVEDRSRESAGCQRSSVVDGASQEVKFGSVINVKSWFEVTGPQGYLVNVIGWRKKGVKNESGQRIKKGRIAKRFSVDKDGNHFRVEVYRDPKFVGMFLVNFGRGPTVASESASSIGRLVPGGVVQ